MGWLGPYRVGLWGNEMLLNRLEYLLMNNPARAALHRHVEARKLLRLGGSIPGGRALEIGCGRGVGIEVIMELFGAGSVDAFDLDPRMVRQAKNRARRFGGKARVWVGDAERISAENGEYDAVFDFGILHHVPDWRAAIREVARVLKPGGRFYVEDVLAAWTANRLARRFFDHPAHGRFDAPALLAALVESGLEAGEPEYFLGAMIFLTATRSGNPALKAPAAPRPG